MSSSRMCSVLVSHVCAGLVVTSDGDFQERPELAFAEREVRNRVILDTWVRVGREGLGSLRP